MQFDQLNGATIKNTELKLRESEEFSDLTINLTDGRSLHIEVQSMKITKAPEPIADFATTNWKLVRGLNPGDCIESVDAGFVCGKQFAVHLRFRNGAVIECISPASQKGQESKDDAWKKETLDTIKNGLIKFGNVPHNKTSTLALDIQLAFSAIEKGDQVLAAKRCQDINMIIKGL